MKLSDESVYKLFNECLFLESELSEGFPIKDFSSFQSVSAPSNLTVYFSSERLNANKKEIMTLIDSLPGLTEGNYLDQLYCDCSGQKWCDDIETIDQLIMLAGACGLITVTIIEEHVLVKRDHTKDALPVEGQRPYSFQIREKELVLRDAEQEALLVQNRERITSELKEYIDFINIGLGFFGIKAVISEVEKNCLEFFEKEVKIASKKFEDADGLVGLNGLLGQRLYSEFRSSTGASITYVVDDNRHIFLSDSPTVDYRIELTLDVATKKIEKALLFTSDRDADYVLKRLEISPTEVKASLNNQFGPFGNYEDGIERTMHYRTAFDDYGSSISMTEHIWPNEGEDTGHNLTSDLKSILLDGKVLIEGLTALSFENLASSIASHPRNRELLTFTLKSLDEQLPGVSEFIKREFSLYDRLVNPQKGSLPTYDKLANYVVQSCMHYSCNIIKKSIDF